MEAGYMITRIIQRDKVHSQRKQIQRIKVEKK